MRSLPTVDELAGMSDEELGRQFEQVRTGDREAAADLREELRHRETRRWHAEIRLLLIALLVVSVVGLVFLAWDAVD
jgi:hypothetical protein